MSGDNPRLTFGLFGVSSSRSWNDSATVVTQPGCRRLSVMLVHDGDAAAVKRPRSPQSPSVGAAEMLRVPGRSSKYPMHTWVSAPGEGAALNEIGVRPFVHANLLSAGFVLAPTCAWYPFRVCARSIPTTNPTRSEHSCFKHVLHQNNHSHSLVQFSGETRGA